MSDLTDHRDSRYMLVCDKVSKVEAERERIENKIRAKVVNQMIDEIEWLHKSLNFSKALLGHYGVTPYTYDDDDHG